MRAWTARNGRLELAVVLTLAAFAAFAPSASAVSQSGAFELDGNALSEAAAGEDWDVICKAATAGTSNPQCTGAGTTAATAVSFTAEMDPAASIFTGGGSKDPEDVSSWAWKDQGGLPDKDNLLHSFAARYTLPASSTCQAPGGETTCDVLVFGSDRFDNSGDAHQAFWFFQNKITLTNTKSGGGFKFDGVHRDGDLLVISNFSNGGTVSTITIYKWNSAVAGNLEQLESSSDAKCGPASILDFCGIVNAADGQTAPWTFLDKSGNSTYLNGEFYEGGINLSALGLADECFSTVVSETRSSTSTTATLKDFVIGQFATCTAAMSTQASTNGSVIPGTAVNDVATVDGSSAIYPSGPVRFFLCAVSASNTTGCTTGGTDLGEVNLAPDLSTPGNSTATSPNVNTGTGLAPGRYCFRAEWGGDLNYTTSLSHTNGTTECFEVKDTSTITTAQKWLPQDTATVTTAGGTPVAGTVRFDLYENGTCSGLSSTFFTDSTASDGFTTNNTTYRTSSTTISWSATFTPSDSNAVVGSTTTRCERSDLTIDNSASPFPPTP